MNHSSLYVYSTLKIDPKKLRIRVKDEFPEILDYVDESTEKYPQLTFKSRLQNYLINKISEERFLLIKNIDDLISLVEISDNKSPLSLIFPEIKEADLKYKVDFNRIWGLPCQQLYSKFHGRCIGFPRVLKMVYDNHINAYSHIQNSKIRVLTYLYEIRSKQAH